MKIKRTKFVCALLRHKYLSPVLVGLALYAIVIIGINVYHYATH